MQQKHIRPGMPASTIFIPRRFPPLLLDPTIERLLAQNAPIGIGVSGGKDSALLTYVLMDYFRNIGYDLKKVLLMYAHLGLIEWVESSVMCQNLADHFGLELVTLESDLIARWWKRWESNVRRYRDLLCVKLIMPFSGPGLMRFCTSENKVGPICRELVRRFPGETMLSASGIRWDESPDRQKAQICKVQRNLERKKANTYGYDWHPILNWTLPEVWAYHQKYNLPRHSAYTRYNCSRVSCSFCVLSSQGNLIGAAQCEENHAAYRQIVPLEIVSTFSFQSGNWLADIAPHLLDSQTLAGIVEAKRRAKKREEAESLLPENLLYVDGWPTAIPTRDEARLLAQVRAMVSEAVGIEIHYTKSDAIRDRYAELITKREAQQAEKARQAERKALRSLKKREQEALLVAQS